MVAHKTHGDSLTLLYGVWLGMRRRCDTPSHTSFPNYGGRGITVCEVWDEEFAAFRRWSLSHGYISGKTELNRIDNDGPYSPANCEWVTPRHNSLNKRSTHFVTAFGETKALVEWSKDPRCQVEYSVLGRRIRRGVEAEAAITSPSGTIRNLLRKA